MSNNYKSRLRFRRIRVHSSLVLSPTARPRSAFKTPIRSRYYFGLYNEFADTNYFKNKKFNDFNSYINPLYPLPHKEHHVELDFFFSFNDDAFLSMLNDDYVFPPKNKETPAHMKKAFFFRSCLKRNSPYDLIKEQEAPTFYKKVIKDPFVITEEDVFRERFKQFSLSILRRFRKLRGVSVALSRIFFKKFAFSASFGYTPFFK
jgi:hypothetical protein